MASFLDIRLIGFVVLFVGVCFFPALRRWWKAKNYARGQRVSRKDSTPRKQSANSTLRWGNRWLSNDAATEHFLVCGTSGSGKSLIQRLLMKEPLRAIGKISGKDSRAVIFDAKNDIEEYLRHIGVSCPIYSFNPFEGGPTATAWNIAADITSSARAMNLAASLIPSEKGGNNQYFTDAARQIVTAVVESFIRHSGNSWRFSDLVSVCINKDAISQTLNRDRQGRAVLDGFFGDERTAFQVFTTVCSRMNYYRPVAALWKTLPREISIRQWLASDSILILGGLATAKTALDAINEQLFRVLVEETDVQSNSSTRRTYIWIDEARLAGPLLKSDLLPFACVKLRSKGVSLVLSFQDIEGMREAAGERVANELVAQMSHKALLRMESDGSSAWAAKQLGQFEAIEYFASESSSTRSISAQRVVRDSVLASEFYQIIPASKKNGVTGYFISPGQTAYRGTVAGNELQPIVVVESQVQSRFRSEFDQWLNELTAHDLSRLSLNIHRELPPEKKRLRFAKNEPDKFSMNQIRIP